ncbi:hypothetical protein WAF17_16200 [Bernardetia sp. ABR2-2B]|uniref:hypothetical protein n=1 Tax=Bernardetia sp. ABR2-2B TaxID=3127472 RepID=UPI0030CDEC31
MKTYKTQDEQVIKSLSNLEIVEQLKNEGRFTRQESIEKYMKGFAERLKEYEGIEIRFDSVDNFVEDLIKNNYLIEINAPHK